MYFPIKFIAYNVRHHRKQAFLLTLAELAESARLPRKLISQIETGTAASTRISY
ncbi:MAG: hypothetical protein HRU35_05870 [Rickettsiaceae bacterium]|nr:hypothetical protein [Rickettsiaceae bacterium]